MSELTVLVATDRTQGRRGNDFCHVPAGELVGLASLCDDPAGDPDGCCGCGRSFTGLSTRLTTTTAEVALRSLTAAQYTVHVRNYLLLCGFRDDTESWDTAEAVTEDMLKLATRYPLGTVLQRRRDRVEPRGQL